MELFQRVCSSCRSEGENQEIAVQTEHTDYIESNMYCYSPLACCGLNSMRCEMIKLRQCEGDNEGVITTDSNSEWSCGEMESGVFDAEMMGLCQDFSFIEKGKSEMEAAEEFNEQVVEDEGKVLNGVKDSLRTKAKIFKFATLRESVETALSDSYEEIFGNLDICDNGFKQSILQLIQCEKLSIHTQLYRKRYSSFGFNRNL